jgi:hypothetical protein
MKTWKLALLIGGLTSLAVFSVGAIAFGAGAGGRHVPFGGGMMTAAGDRADDGWRGCEGRGLLQDPEARDDLAKLREEHRADMRAWQEKYGTDPSSDAARKALDELRAEHLKEMRALFEKYGVEPPQGLGEGAQRGSGWGGACGGRGCDGRAPNGTGWNGGPGMMGGPAGTGATSL